MQKKPASIPAHFRRRNVSAWEEMTAAWRARSRLAAHAHHMQQAMLLIHILAFQAGQRRDPQPAPQSQFGQRGERRSLFFQQFHDLYSIFFLVTEAWLVHIVVTVIFYMIAQFEIVFEIPPSWRQPFACELQRGSLILTTTTHMTTQAINQPTASGATISWLSQAHLDCYLHGQGYTQS